MRKQVTENRSRSADLGFQSSLNVRDGPQPVTLTNKIARRMQASKEVQGIRRPRKNPFRAVQPLVSATRPQMRKVRD